jgi:hypothetical protein
MLGLDAKLTTGELKTYREWSTLRPLCRTKLSQRRQLPHTSSSGKVPTPQIIKEPRSHPKSWQSHLTSPVRPVPSILLTDHCPSRATDATSLFLSSVGRSTMLKILGLTTHDAPGMQFATCLLAATAISISARIYKPRPQHISTSGMRSREDPMLTSSSG